MTRSVLSGKSNYLAGNQTPMYQRSVIRMKRVGRPKFGVISKNPDVSVLQEAFDEKPAAREKRFKKLVKQKGKARAGEK